jgi:hypothetical protein
MEANELRIGNYVCDSYNIIQKIHTVEVGSISEEYYVRFRKYINNVISIDDLDPIPLTEEWLLKFGFTDDEEKGFSSDEANRKIYSLNGFDLSIEENGKIHEWVEVEDQWYSYKGKEFKFVHKLQNFYYESKDKELSVSKTQH